MTQYIEDARLCGYHPGNDSILASDADYIFTDDLQSADVTERGSDFKGTGSFGVFRHDDPTDVTVHPGDRLAFFVDDIGAESGYGEGGYGTGPYGGGQDLRWMGMARNLELSEESTDNFFLTINAEEFAPCVMAIRSAYATYEDRQISGTTNSICNEILRDNCPELSTDRLPTVTDTTTIYLRGQTVLETMASLAVRAGRLLVSDGFYVDLTQPQTITPQFTATQGTDVGTFETTINDDNLVNDLRVEGGTGHDPESQSAQTIVNGYEDITQTDRIFYQINTRKSSIERVEVWTHKTGSGENFIARLQKDQNGAPIAPNDNKSDIVSRNLAPQFVDPDGYTSFLFSEHTLPEPFPWLILETDGPVGQEIGVNTNVTPPAPGVIPHFPYQIILNRTSPGSIDVYRRREDKVSNDSIGTFAAARDKATEVLATRDEPIIQVTLTAYSDRMHALHPGTVITLANEKARAVGDFVVLETRDLYETGQLNTELTLKQLD